MVKSLIFQFRIRLIVLSFEYIIRLLISLALCLFLRNVLGVKIIVNLSINLAVKKEFTAKRVRTFGGSLKKSRAVGSFGKCEVMLQITSFG